MSSNVKNTIEEMNAHSTNFTSRTYNFGNVQFDFRKSYVMGILNVTPDSFSDGGKYFDKQSAIDHALKMIEQGASIIDIGGESTRPGSAPITADEELSRIIPVIKGILNKNPEAVISVDTTKTKVAEKSLSIGAKIVNDISGLTFEPELAQVIGDYDAGLIIMHIKGTPTNMQKNPYYDDVVREVNEFFLIQSQKAESSGVKKIFIDPGIGFGKRLEDNLQLINKLDFFLNLSYPIVIGISRKSFIGKILDLDVSER
ncbi:MAG TPA: dihydropteroate synthase, partial [Ignavibacteriaceae bacterium]